MNKIREMYYKWYSGLLLLLLYYIIIHLFMNSSFGDDIRYKNYWQDYKEWIKYLYQSWTIRPLPDTISALILNYNIWIWRILNIIILVSIPYLINLIIFGHKYKQYINYIVSLWLLYPLTHQSTAGWVVTTVYYIWGIFFGLYCILILKKIIFREHVQLYHYIFGIFAIAYTTSSEQNAVIFILILLSTGIYGFRNKIGIKYIMILFIITLCNILIYMLSPGKANRYIIEHQWFIDYSMLTLPDKIHRGFLEITTNLFMNVNLLNIVLCLFVFYSVWVLNKNKLIRTMAAIPLMIQILFGIFHEQLNSWFPEVMKYIPNMTSYYNGFSQYSGIITFDNYFQITTYIPLIIMIISCCFLTISIYYSFSSKIVGILASLLYAIGIILTTAIGLSPTLYASSHRTHTLLYIIIIMIISLMYYYNEYMFTVKQKKSIKYILLFIAYFSLFIQTILIIELFEKFH